MSKLVFRNTGDLALAMQMERDSIILGLTTDMFVKRLDGEIALATTATKETVAEHVRTLRQKIDSHLHMDYIMFTSIRLELLAGLCARFGQIDNALDAVHEALDLSRQFDEYFWDAEIYRMQGDLLVQQGASRVEIEISYRRAMETARAQNATSLELRAATSLAEYLFAQGEGDSAKQMLQPIYDWFSEGFDTSDLRAANQLLCQ